MAGQMTESPRSDWHVHHAQAAEADVRMMQRWIAATDDLLERFEGDEEVQLYVRSASGLVRTRRDDRADFGRLMRARAVDESDGAVGRNGGDSPTPPPLPSHGIVPDPIRGEA